MNKLSKVALWVSAALFSQVSYAQAPIHQSELQQQNKPLSHLNYHTQSPELMGKHLRQQKKTRSMQAAASCYLQDFMISDATLLTQRVENASQACIQALYDVPTNMQHTIFSDANMQTIANNLRTHGRNFKGGVDAPLQASLDFIHAGYVNAYYNQALQFSSSTQMAFKYALDAIIDSGHFYRNDASQASLVETIFYAINNATLQKYYFKMYTQWLNTFDQSYANNTQLRNAIFQLFDTLYRGSFYSDFISQASYENDLVYALKKMIKLDSLVNTDSEFMLSAAALELGRLKAYGGSIESTVDAVSRDILTRYSKTSFGRDIWITLADSLRYSASCEEHGICGWEQELKETFLAQQHHCHENLVINAQAMTHTQLNSACDVMHQQNILFHEIAATFQAPVENDYNTSLNVNIFDSPYEYKILAKGIFNMDTNNGGMYFEGVPSDPHNVTNFVAHEASYAHGAHYVWNLAHEYVHYLDGRYNLYGGYSAPQAPVMWWVEGFAEYVSKQNHHADALAIVKAGTRVPFSQIRKNNRNSPADHIYSWGYLAVRFMFERHQDEVDNMLTLTRSGNWTQYQVKMNQWAAQYNSEFSAWVDSVADGVIEGRPKREYPEENQFPVVKINGPYQGAVNQPIQFSSQDSYDADGYIQSYFWQFGDGATSTLANPSHQYTAPGNYQASLTLTDDKGDAYTEKTSVYVSETEFTRLEHDSPLSISGEKGAELIHQLTIPEGVSRFDVAINGGQGDADLYIKRGYAPTADDYDCRPFDEGNNETCQFENAKAGEYFVTVYGFTQFDTTLSATFEQASQLPNACQTRGPIQNGHALSAGVAECVTTTQDLWLSLGEMSDHNSVAVTIANGEGNIDIHYSASGWPTEQNTNQSSQNANNNECIYIENPSQYWGYFKLTGTASNATLIVDFDTAGCR